MFDIEEPIREQIDDCISDDSDEDQAVSASLNDRDSDSGTVSSEILNRVLNNNKTVQRGDQAPSSLNYTLDGESNATQKITNYLSESSKMQQLYSDYK